MKTVRDWVLLVDKLTELTQYNKISWKREDAPRYLQSSINRIDFVYFTHFNNQRIRLYEDTFKYYTDEDVYYWETEAVLDLVDDFGNSTFDVPKTKNINNLLQAVKYQAANINNFFEGW